MLQATRTLIIALLCISCSTSAPPLSQPQPRESSPTPPLAKDSDAAEADHQAALFVVRSADRVETFRVRSRLTLDDTRRAKDPQFSDKYLDQLWPIEKRGPVLSQDFARRLEAFLLDESNFVGRTPGGDKACIFSPGVVFQFRNGSDFVGIVICFDCAQLATYSSKGDLNIPSIDFDPGYSRLSALAKEAFPNDGVIRALR